jgi:hypothetical protein
MPAAPSLLIVPYRSKTGKLYSQIPTSGAGDFTVTRNTAARRFNSAGLLESVASGIPRLDYATSGGTVGCPALLVEPAATNLCLQSTDTTTSWALGANLTSGAIDVIGVSGINLTVAVSGSSIGDTAGANRMATINATLTSGSTYTISFLMKKTGAHTIGGFFANTSGATSTAFGSGFDVSGSFSSGSLIATSPITNRIRRVERFGSDVFRCSETFTMTATNVLTVLRLGPTVSVTSLTNSAVGTELGFAAPQIELGSVPTSFIPTTAGTGSRSADVISVSGAVSGSIGQTAGTIYCEFAFLGTPTARSGPIYLRQAASRGMGINFSPSDSPTGISFISRNDGGSTVLTIVSGALQLGTFYKVAIGYDAAGTAVGGSQASGVVAYVNGVQTAIGTLRVPDAAGLTEFRMYAASAGSDTEAFNGRIRAAALYTTRLTNAELATLTTP